MMRPVRAEDPAVPPPTPNRAARRWVPFAIAGGLLLAAAAVVGGVLAATADDNSTAHPGHRPSTTPSITVSASASSTSSTSVTSSPTSATTTSATTSAPAAVRTIRLVRSGTCPATTYQGRSLGCSNYDIVLSGFPAGSQRLTVRSCFGTAKCYTKAKAVTVGADGSGTLSDGIQRVYDGYVLTVRQGPTGAATQAP